MGENATILSLLTSLSEEHGAPPFSLDHTDHEGNCLSRKWEVHGLILQLFFLMGGVGLHDYEIICRQKS